MMCSVQQKISCLFQPIIKTEPSNKHAQQQYSVTASDILSEDANSHGIRNASVSEKVDGTCCYVALHQDKSCLWARLDRKPNKAADKKFKKYLASKRAKQSQNSSPPDEEFVWNPEKDFKDVPVDWMPALGVPIIDNVPQPDSNGHIPGWVPVLSDSRQYCWHDTVVDRQDSTVVIMRPSKENDCSLEISLQPLDDLLGQTVELVGTHVNGNPYKMGCKSSPLHVLVPHGCIPINHDNLDISYTHLRTFLSCEAGGKMEGLVWRCPGGQLYKLHRNHLDLPWPITDPVLSSRPVIVNTVRNCSGDSQQLKTNIGRLRSLNGRTFSCMSELNEALADICV